MIGSLRGKIANKSSDWILIDVSGVGYKIFVIPELIPQLKVEEETIFYTYLNVREDILNLYGFRFQEQLELFELLITVSGVGPRAALGILSIGDVSYLKKAIFEGRGDIITTVSGVGKKMADRLILELKSKVAILGDSVSLPTHLTEEDEEAAEALVGLGYKKQEARKALAKVSNEIDSPGEKIKEALKLLGK